MDENMKKVIMADFDAKDLKQKNIKSIYVRECPKCKRTWKLNVNAEKGVFRCAACGESGNAIKLHSLLRGISLEKAKDEVLGINEKELKPIIFKENGSSDSLADLNIRSALYSSLIRQGYLSKSAYADLERRGLPIEECERYIFIPTLDKEGKNYRSELWIDDKFKGPLYKDGKIYSIPGIYGKVTAKNGKESYGRLSLALPLNDKGYLIPITTHGDNDKPKISCCQIRHLGKDIQTRYTYLTSDGLKGGIGVGGCNKIHYTKNFWKNKKLEVPKTVNLTEGPLKADVAAYLSGRCFIAVPGVNSTADLPGELAFLKSKGCESINLCFDMDYRDKPEVKKALEKVKSIIKDADLKVNVITWNSNYKGIDDYLLSKKRHLMEVKKDGE